MPALSTPEAPPEEDARESTPGKNRLPNKGQGATEQKPKSAEKAPWYGKEAKGGDGATTEISETQRRKMMENMYPTDPKSTETPWQHARNWTRQPLKTGTKIGLFALNPVVYSSVYAADWLAQRTPGVKNLYSAPREIVRSTADKTMNVLNGAATFVPAAPFNVAHEIHDKVAGMDKSKPTTLIGKLTDKLGDVVGGAYNLTKGGIEKIYELGKKVGVPALEMAGAAISAPFKLVFGTIGKAFEISGKFPFPANIITQLALLTGVGMGSHIAIGASLGAINPATQAIYTGMVNTVTSTIGGWFGV